MNTLLRFIGLVLRTALITTGLVIFFLNVGLYVTDSHSRFYPNPELWIASVALGIALVLIGKSLSPQRDAKDHFPIKMLLLYFIIHAGYLALLHSGMNARWLDPLRVHAETICVYTIGSVILAGLYWQYMLTFKKDWRQGNIPQRIKVTIVLCLVFLVGIVGREIIEIFIFKNETHTLVNLFRLIFHALLLSVILLTKTYFGPLLLTGTLAVLSFEIILKGKFNALLLANHAMSIVLDAFPESIQNIYLGFSLIYVVSVNFVDTLTGGGGGDVPDA